MSNGQLTHFRPDCRQSKYGIIKDKEEIPMAQQCPASTTRKHTDTFARLYSTILNELKERKVPAPEDAEELAMALSVLVADELKVDIYQ
jgi:predicted ATPase